MQVAKKKGAEEGKKRGRRQEAGAMQHNGRLNHTYNVCLKNSSQKLGLQIKFNWIPCILISGEHGIIFSISISQILLGTYL